ncbi:MAG TPA: hypothetical protein VM577_09025 [Anaerovoracaceae bacterium]|nr:hypothetical protein [Anaerovoracaceae bacterium]
MLGMPNNTNHLLTGCVTCGVINVDANHCQNCGTYIPPEDLWYIYNYMSTHPVHIHASIKNSILKPGGSLDLQVSTGDVKMQEGATCHKCKEFFPYANTDKNFLCWACKNIWT